MSSRNRNRNRNRNRSNNSSPQKSQSSSSQPQEKMTGWSMKTTRVKKRNARKPTGAPKQQSPPNNNKKNKTSRAARRRKNKWNKANAINNDDGNSNDPNSTQSSPTPQINNMVNAIINSIEYDGDRKVIIQVIQQLNLTSFDPNNEGLKLQILNTIQNIKVAELNGDEEPDQNQNQRQNQNQQDQSENVSVDNDNQQDDDQESEDDEDSEDESEEEDGDDNEQYDDEDGQQQDEDQENGYDDDQEPEQDDDDIDDQKSSSEEQQRIDDNESGAADDDKKEEEVPELNQRPKKRKRRKRNRKKNRDKQQNENEEDDQQQDDNQQEQDIIDNDDQFDEDITPKKPQKQNKTKRKRKKSKGVKDLNLRNVNESIQQLNKWRDQLQSEIDNKSVSQKFLSSFMQQNGIVEIAEKVILNLGDINYNNRQNFNQLSQCIISLFDIMLSGTHDYHQWLFNRLCDLAQEIMKLSNSSSDDNASNNNNQQLISTICKETRSLIDAQTLNLQNRGGDIVFRKDHFHEPSALLDDGHTDKDPIVPLLSQLDNDLIKIADYFHDLRKHDSQIKSTCPTSSESFTNEYSMIRTQLENKVTKIQSQSNLCCDRLAEITTQKQSLQRRQEEKLRPLKEQLRDRGNERYGLLQEKQRLEQQLEQIKQNLTTVDMYIDDTNREINKIQSRLQPQEDELTSKSTNYQFEIAGYQQQMGCYNALLNIVNQSYSKLHSWSNNRIQRDSTDRDQLENNYVNALARYLTSLCVAKNEISTRVQHLQDGIDQFKRTNEISNKRYGQQRNIDNHLNKYEQDINIDQNTNKNIEQDMYSHIDRAMKIVTPDYFRNFIDHLQNKTQIGDEIDLSKYQNLNQQQQRRSPPRNRRPVRNTQSTQTQQMNGSGGLHRNNNMNQNQNQQRSNMPNNQPRPRKAPLSTNKSSQSQQQSQQQRGNNGGSKPPMRTYQNQQNNQNQNNNNNYNRPQKRPLTNNNQSFGQY